MRLAFDYFFPIEYTHALKKNVMQPVFSLETTIFFDQQQYNQK